ncbi:hypothetical protein BKA63DRAFT_497425 [Paraphoma chrysanthemicola]|nr:hypothetical protein BKA63DRAFT_497425 [Paraphoma chrysanthemicola]
MDVIKPRQQFEKPARTVRGHEIEIDQLGNVFAFDRGFDGGLFERNLVLLAHGPTWPGKARLMLKGVEVTEDEFQEALGEIERFPPTRPTNHNSAGSSASHMLIRCVIIRGHHKREIVLDDLTGDVPLGAQETTAEYRNPQKEGEERKNMGNQMNLANADLNDLYDHLWKLAPECGRRSVPFRPKRSIVRQLKEHLEDSVV